MRARSLILRSLIGGAVLLISSWPSLGVAQVGSPEQTTVRIVGRENALVTTREIRLGDLADVSSKRTQDDEVVIGLKRLVVRSSPKPGARIEISATDLLARLREEGIELSQIGYTFPKKIKVQRAGRMLGKDEVLQRINQFLQENKRDISVRELSFPAEIQIAPGEVTYKVSSFETGRNAEIGFLVEANVGDEQQTQLKLTAQIDEWREMPVASRSITRGSIIGATDYAMARLNTARLPREAAGKIEDVLGKEVVQNIGSGEAFMLNKLNIPPIVRSGSKVTMVYRSKLLEATAGGIALEDAIPGQTVKVRNENSKRVIFGIAREEGLVEVTP